MLLIATSLATDLHTILYNVCITYNVNDANNLPNNLQICFVLAVLLKFIQIRGGLFKSGFA